MSEEESASGVKTADDGARYIGGSTRADGTVRKQIKVRPGFVPTEDVAKYVPRNKRGESTEGKIESAKVNEESTVKKVVRPVRHVKGENNEQIKKPVRRIKKELSEDSNEKVDDDDDLTNVFGKLNVNEEKDDKQEKIEAKREEKPRSRYVPPHLRNK